MPTVCIFQEKEVNKMLFFIVNIGHEEVKIIKDHTLVYLIPAQCDRFSDAEENNQESKIANTSGATSKTKAEILPAIPTSSKMIFLGNNTPVRKVLLQDAKISVDVQEKLYGLIHVFQDIVFFIK